jgi:hypothetical protein
MGKKRVRRSQRGWEDWREGANNIPPHIIVGMGQARSGIEGCVMCDSRQVRYLCSLVIQRPDLGEDRHEQHVHGLCELCADRYNPEEMEIIMTQRYGRAQA